MTSTSIAKPAHLRPIDTKHTLMADSADTALAVITGSEQENQAAFTRLQHACGLERFVFCEPELVVTLPYAI